MPDILPDEGHRPAEATPGGRCGTKSGLGTSARVKGPQFPDRGVLWLTWHAWKPLT
ncbi:MULTISPECIES: hypothetical protein [Mycobacteriaceae]|uniref:Uncharacterized protein n=1 Tax=Mycolicibacterium parafortuitum TaxID=39692 RepID=A0ACC6MJQ0_MYCPF|nr:MULTISPECIES: hypothetical protein [Mycobacteriaceae]MDZ5087210.1 hypothetical protein [Mycolicibacterium parafortuitum]